jgi:hypothetical protein
MLFALEVPLDDGELTNVKCPKEGCDQKLRYQAVGGIETDDPLFIPIAKHLYRCDVHGAYAFDGKMLYPVEGQ